MLCVLAVGITFKATGISLSHTVMSQNIEDEGVWSHPENSLLVQNFDNQHNRTNFNFIFVIISILAMIKINQHQNNR